MSLRLYFHPLASFCQKVLIALYENNTAFEPHIVDLRNEASRAEFLKVWPIGKFPVLHDSARGETIPESSIIIEYLGAHYPGATCLVPNEKDLAREVRLRDRLYDLYLHLPMQKVVGDRLRPAGKKDPYGVEEAKAQLRTSLGMLDRELAAKTWAMGETFSMADCAAGPPLFFINMVLPLADAYKNVSGYLGRLMARASYARVLEEAKPYLSMFPREN